MRQIGNVLLAIMAILFFLAVVTFMRPQTFFSGQIFVSESGNGTLELQVDSRPSSVIPAVGGTLSGGRLFGKQSGLYTLTTAEGTSSGEFAWGKGPLCCGPLDDQTLTFWPKSGNQWTVSIRQDGSFQDSKEMLWRVKTPTR